MSNMPGKNPYRPGVGLKPRILAGREPEMRRFEAGLRAAPEIPLNIRLTGLRGVGKTVLLHELDDLARKSNWTTAFKELEPRHNFEDELLKVLLAVLDEAKRRLSAIERLKAGAGAAASALGGLGVKYQDLEISFDTPENRKERDLAKSLLEVTALAERQSTGGFVLLLDEAQVLRDTSADGEYPLSLLLAAISAVQKVQAPLVVVMSGLPPLTSHLLKARSYSERMFRGEEIGSLGADDARSAFAGPLIGTGVEASDQLVARVLETVQGYPYFIQLWGAELWDAADQSGVRVFTPDLLDAVEHLIYRRLDRDFYDPRFQTATPAEQDLLLLAAKCPYPPLRVSDLQHTTTKTPGNVNVLLGRLVEAGVLYRLRKGEYGYTAPQFEDYLRRRTGLTAPETTTRP